MNRAGAGRRAVRGAGRSTGRACKARGEAAGYRTRLRDAETRLDGAKSAEESEDSTHELGIQPEAYDPKLDVDFTPLRGQDPAAGGFVAAA
ncbi:hypothetical protein OOK13_42210 [Streptomyces sp. NBC_00378]|uniref:hypothetical protein n=1 Tax=unclassified Streptomyces TaxID=2593676 RepID=UPI002254F2BE|nr:MULTISPECIES: hypothetical protein [unclassified Streptomyces]MCX5114946.1 hypothetical protein [Streptomyces sp. NBC_00378]